MISVAPRLRGPAVQFLPSKRTTSCGRLTLVLEYPMPQQLVGDAQAMVLSWVTFPILGTFTVGVASDTDHASFGGRGPGGPSSPPTSPGPPHEATATPAPTSSTTTIAAMITRRCWSRTHVITEARRDGCPGAGKSSARSSASAWGRGSGAGRRRAKGLVWAGSSAGCDAMPADGVEAGGVGLNVGTAGGSAE